MEYVVAALAGYLLGSIPFAAIVAARHGVDLRRAGDGNPGAWNALEQLGARRAWPAFAGDGLKGTAAGLIGVALGGTSVGYVAVAAAMVGHALPAFARLRGGKAVMTFAGGMFAVAPPAAAAALALCVATGLGARSFAWGARAGVFGFVPLQLALQGARPTAATGALMCLIATLFLVRRSGARATTATGAASRP